MRNELRDSAARRCSMFAAWSGIYRMEVGGLGYGRVAIRHVRPSALSVNAVRHTNSNERSRSVTPISTVTHPTSSRSRGRKLPMILDSLPRLAQLTDSLHVSNFISYSFFQSPFDFIAIITTGCHPLHLLHIVSLSGFLVDR